MKLLNKAIDKTERMMEFIDEIIFCSGIAAVFISPYIILAITLIHK